MVGCIYAVVGCVYAVVGCIFAVVGCMHKILVHAQDSCACTTLLCMHNTLVHALEGPGTKAGTKKKQPPRAGPAYWRHPITLRSLVVRSTDVGPKIFQKVNICLIIFKK